MAKISTKTKLRKYQKIILDLLQKHADYLQNYPEYSLVLDAKSRNYLLLYIGWNHNKYEHNVILHFRLAEDGKVWVMLNHTDKPFEIDLLTAGVPAQDIVLGMKTPKMRALGEFAVE